MQHKKPLHFHKTPTHSFKKHLLIKYCGMQDTMQCNRDTNKVRYGLCLLHSHWLAWWIFFFFLIWAIRIYFKSPLYNFTTVWFCEGISRFCSYSMKKLKWERKYSHIAWWTLTRAKYQNYLESLSKIDLGSAETTT